MIFNRVRFDRPGVVNLPRGSFLASRETIVQSRPSRSRSRRPPSEDYINSASRVPQVANWALASVCFFPDVLDRTTGMINAWNATWDHEKTNFSAHLPERISMGPTTPRAVARGEGRHRESTEGGAQEERATCVCTLVHRKFRGIHVDGPNGRPTECCNLAPAPFLSILFLGPPPSRLFFFDKSPRDFSR